VDLEKSRRARLLDRAFGKGELERSESNLHLCCPSCDDSKKKKLYVALDTGWYNCWVCGLSGKNVYFLFRKYAPKFASECTEVFPNTGTLLPLAHEKREEVAELPEDVKLVVECLSDPNARDVYRYLQGRGVSKLDVYQWRVCVSQDFTFRRKAIFPSFDSEGELNYFVARSIDDSKFKYKNAKVPKNRIIFNEMDINWNDPVVLVEGVFDAVKCPENTVPILGSTLSKKSLLHARLAQHRSTVVVAFDEDAESKSHIVCNRLMAAGCTVFKCTVTGDDLGSRSKCEVEKILSTAQPWLKISQINHKIASIKSGSIL